MEQHALKNVNTCLNCNIYSYLSGGQSSNLYINVVHFFKGSKNVLVQSNTHIYDLFKRYSVYLMVGR
jgi:hypothetical protein